MRIRDIMGRFESTLTKYCERNTDFFRRCIVNFATVLYNPSKPKKARRNLFESLGKYLLRRIGRIDRQNEPRRPNSKRGIGIGPIKSYFIGNQEDYNYIRTVCQRAGVEFTDTYFRTAWDCYGGANLTQTKA